MLHSCILQQLVHGDCLSTTWQENGNKRLNPEQRNCRTNLKTCWMAHIVWSLFTIKKCSSLQNLEKSPQTEMPNLAVIAFWDWNKHVSERKVDKGRSSKFSCTDSKGMLEMLEEQRIYFKLWSTLAFSVTCHWWFVSSTKNYLLQFVTETNA